MIEVKRLLQLMSMSPKPALFEISSDIKARRMHVVLASGLWDDEALTRFRAAIVAEAERFHANKRSFDVIADLREFPVQTQNTASVGRSTIFDVRDKGLRRSAIVVGNILSKMQIARMAGNDDHRYFTSYDEAIAWLKPDSPS